MQFLFSCRTIVQHFCVGSQISIETHLAELLDSQLLVCAVRFVIYAQDQRMVLQQEVTLPLTDPLQFKLGKMPEKQKTPSRQVRTRRAPG